MNMEIPKTIKMSECGYENTSNGDLVLFQPLYEKEDIGKNPLSELVIGMFGHEMYPEDAQKLYDALGEHLALSKLHQKKKGQS